MSQIGTLLTGAGVQTVISGQSQTEMYIVLGDVDTTMPLTGITVEVDGEPTINLSGSTPIVSAFAKLLMQSCAGTIGLQLPLATGKIGKNTTYRLTNGGVTTPAIYAYSDQDNGAPVIASTKGINPSSYDTFDRFSTLLISPSANVSNCEVTFADDSKATMTVQELDAWFASKWPTQADGRLESTVTAIYNGDQSVKSVKVNATTALTVASIKLPDDYFQQKMAEARRR